MKKSPLEHILNQLLSGEFVSGEELAQYLNISRTWVWNQIKILKQLGFEIESSAKKGYKLISIPDVLIPPLIKPYLTTDSLGKKIYFFEELPSTQDKAKKLAEQGEEEGTLILCESQLKGRGRRGRQWVHVPKKSLSFSIILRPNLSPSEVMQLPLVAGLAICKAIGAHTNLKAELKWPNDILINNKKVVGILAEISGDIEFVNYVILGVGINVNLDQEDIPYELQDYATSLYLEGKKNFKRAHLLGNILMYLEYWYNIYLKEGFKSIRTKWIDMSNTIHRNVIVFLKDKKLYGKAIDLDENGNLMVMDNKNKIHKIMYGDVTLRNNS
ncbi:biotin--[acetyl-CoA-carboxylase] ligase [Desulfothermus okinawensis JCM 13304]